MSGPASAPQEQSLLRELWGEALGDPELVHGVEEVLRLLTDSAAEAEALPSDQWLRALGRELAWTSQWMVQISESWRATEELEAWEDLLLAHAEAVAHDVAQLARSLVGGEPLPVHLGDGLRGWRLWHLEHGGRGAVVRMLQALEQSVERTGGRRDAGLALLGELHAAEQGLQAAATELGGLSAHPVAAEALPKLSEAVTRLHAARKEGAAGARAWREQRASVPTLPPVPSPVTDPAVPLPLLALDLLLARTPAVGHDEARNQLAEEILRRETWDHRCLHPQAIATLIVGDLLDPARRRDTLGRLGREIAAGRAAARLIESLLPAKAPPRAVPEALRELVAAGRLQPWEAEAYLLVHRGMADALGSATHNQEENPHEP